LVVLQSFDKRYALALLLIGASASSVRAQLSVGAGLGGAVQREASDPWQSMSTFDPVLRLDGRWFQMNGAANFLSGTSQTMQLDSGSVGFLAAPPAFGAFRITTTGALSRLTVSPFTQRTTGTMESALSAHVGGWGGWFGFASTQTHAISSLSNRPQSRMGLWRQLGDVTVSVSREASGMTVPGGQVTITRDSLGQGLSADTLRTRLLAWNSLQGRVAWTIGNMSFDTRIGVQPKIGSNPRSTWGSATATLEFASRLAIVASAGNQPINPTLDMPAKKFVSLGLRVAPSSLLRSEAPPHIRPIAANFVLQPIGNREFVVSIRAPSARVVELSGDFDEWKPIALYETRPDVWETTLTLAAGTYRMNVRVNGDSWTAPPGLPSTTDDFNGTVGLVVVR
jgi:hypothetical protein